MGVVSGGCTHTSKEERIRSRVVCRNAMGRGTHLESALQEHAARGLRVQTQCVEQLRLVNPSANRAFGRSGDRLEQQLEMLQVSRLPSATAGFGSSLRSGGPKLERIVLAHRCLGTITAVPGLLRRAHLATLPRASTNALPMPPVALRRTT